jgi:3-oxoadipate enol-lactonase
MGQGRVESPPGSIVRDVDATPVAWREVLVGAVDASRRPVAFLHGLGGSRVAWDPQLDALAAGRRGLAWDMPGYGASAPLPAMTFAALADRAATWLASAGAAPAHVVGLSMGGMVALHLALAHPEVVRSLVLIDSSPAFGFDGSITADAWIEARLARLREGETPATIARGSITAIAAPGASEAAIGLGVEAMSRVTPAAYEQAVRCLVTHDVRSRLATVGCPTLVLVGELDRETPVPFSEHLATTIPVARLEVVPGAGHLSSLERPDVVNPIIADFLEEHD